MPNYIRAIFILVLTLAGGCSSFNREWEAAADAPTGPADLTGRWRGSWVSQADGHRGELRCVISEPCENRYRAHFKATYWKIFQFEYALNLRAKPPANGQVEFVGKEDLGWLAGGLYQYNGAATAQDFHCQYSSKYDFGTFSMKRP